MESFLSRRKIPLVHHVRVEAKMALFEYIEIYYNDHWFHSSIGYRAPPKAREYVIVRLAA